MKKMNENQKLNQPAPRSLAPMSCYAQRDMEGIEDLFFRNMQAMTTEDLHSKADIAMELAWRDNEIKKFKFLAHDLAVELYSSHHIKKGSNAERLIKLAV